MSIGSNEGTYLKGEHVNGLKVAQSLNFLIMLSELIIINTLIDHFFNNFVLFQMGKVKNRLVL